MGISNENSHMHMHVHLNELLLVVAIYFHCFYGRKFVVLKAILVNCSDFNIHLM